MFFLMEFLQRYVKLNMLVDIHNLLVFLLKIVII